ncbi:MAG: hypothetical protein JSS49_00925 [Planctomycetes bacterium]|nr:hypothetical protein [Planctomycetota bacterium]
MTFLHWFGDTIREQLMRVPLWGARWLFIGLLLLMMGWVVQLPASAATPPGRRCEWYEDLRIWAWVALMFQVILYSVF